MLKSLRCRRSSHTCSCHLNSPDARVACSIRLTTFPRIASRRSSSAQSSRASITFAFQSSSAKTTPRFSRRRAARVITFRLRASSMLYSCHASIACPTHRFIQRPTTLPTLAPITFFSAALLHHCWYAADILPLSMRLSILSMMQR